MSDWKQCRIGSCKRHEECMYRPCRAPATTDTDGLAASDPALDPAYNLGLLINGIERALATDTVPPFSVLMKWGQFGLTARAGIEAQAARIAVLEGALEGIQELAEWRIADGREMGASIWRIALEDIAKNVRQALGRVG